MSDHVDQWPILSSFSSLLRPLQASGWPVPHIADDEISNLAVMVQCLLVLSVLFSSPACFPPLSVFLFITSPVLFPPHSPHLFSDPLVSVSVYIAFGLPHVFASSLRDAPCDSTSFGPSRCDCSVASPPVSSLVGMFGFWFLIFSFELSFAFLLHLV